VNDRTRELLAEIRKVAYRLAEASARLDRLEERQASKNGNGSATLRRAIAEKLQDLQDLNT
jgi:hypothetical protein